MNASNKSTNDLKVHIWMNFPSHHQSGFFNSLLRHGVDLKVTYYEPISSHRVALGWGNTSSLQEWECALSETQLSPEQRLHELSDYIHILPGYGTSLTRALAIKAATSNIKWCHWSEASFSGPRWFARYLIKRWYADLVNKTALGAFAQGNMAQRDFIRWGIHTEKIAHLSYSVKPLSDDCEADERIMKFANGRSVFLFIGRIARIKAIDVQIRAFAKLKTNEWCQVFVGNGDTNKYRELASQLNVSDKILFLPPKAWSEIASVYKAGNVVLLPSRFDGWGAVANEAASLSKALILSTRCGSAAHLVEAGINGFLVKPGCPDSLATAMNFYVHGGKTLADQHGLESKRIVEDFTCDASAMRLIKTLQSWLIDDF